MPARLIPEGSRPANLPRPVILDTYLRLRTDCKLLNNFRQRSGPQPWIFCSSINSLELKERQSALTAAGAVVFSVECEDGKGELHKQGIKNLMVEGGATVINSFLECAYQSYGSGSPPIFDILIITTTPTLVGDDAVGYKCCTDQFSNKLPWQHIRTEVMGKDTVVAVRCPPRLP
ncbi:hypothetical protein ID866_4001 [Astraeus odoratus]|nr:hypothetical protein ID866_4001 [Astraeus odoratus]